MKSRATKKKGKAAKPPALVTVRQAAEALGVGVEVAKKLCQAHAIGTVGGATRPRKLTPDDVAKLKAAAASRNPVGRPRSASRRFP